MNASEIRSIKSAITASVHHYIDVANEKLDAGLEYPHIDFTVKGACGGKARGTNFVNFNLMLAKDNLAEYVNQVCPHEVAHLTVNKKWGREVRVTRTGKIQRISHGKKFYYVMRVFGVREERCHSMDTSNVTRTRNTKQFAVVCTGCGFEGHVGTVRRNKMLKGATYSHRCGNRRTAPIVLK